MKNLVLASKSPRRKEILEMLAWKFRVDSEETKEEFIEGQSIEENMQRIALEKAKAVQKRHSEDIILACDTVVVVEGKVLGKPRDEEEAKAMLRKLSGKSSEVYSAVALVDVAEGREKTFVEKTKIYFYPLTEEEIEDYVATGEAMDKAGAYAIQGKASLFIERIEGDYWNVVGLPISKVYRALEKWKWKAC